MEDEWVPGMGREGRIIWRALCKAPEAGVCLEWLEQSDPHEV